MYKLLTEEEKVKVTSEYNLRRLAVIIFALCLVIIVTIVGFLPSYLLSVTRESAALDRTKILETIEPHNKEELESWLKKINTELKTLSPKLDTDRPSEFFESILKEKSAGIKVSNLLWEKQEVLVLTVEGVARTRQALINFETKLKQSGKFKEVALPISNLAKDEDIKFQIKLTP